jgi:condensin complex subunit 2
LALILASCSAIWLLKDVSKSSLPSDRPLTCSGGGAEEDAENEEGGEGGADGVKKRKAARQEATLAKSAAQLQTKKFDLEFTIDPLFKKTSGDFDEGGAQGLLMNHLGVDSGLRVIFDAMDTSGGAEEVEDEEVVSLQVSLADLRGIAILFAD